MGACPEISNSAGCCFHCWYSAPFAWPSDFRRPCDLPAEIASLINRVTRAGKSGECRRWTSVTQSAMATIKCLKTQDGGTMMRVKTHHPYHTLINVECEVLWMLVCGETSIYNRRDYSSDPISSVTALGCP